MEGFLPTIARIAAFVGVFYALIVGGLYTFQRHLLYIPTVTATPPAPASVGLPTAQVMTVRTADGLSLTGLFIPPAPTKPTVVLFHGNGGNFTNMAPTAAIFHRAGFGVLLAEYRGYAANLGSPSEKGLEQDAAAFLSALKERGIKEKDTILYGHSLGSGVAVWAAVQAATAGTPVKAVILESAYTSLPDVAAAVYWFVPVRALMKDRFDTLSRIDHINAPLLMMHGLADTTISPLHTQRLLKKAKDPKQGIFMPSGGHNDLSSFGSIETAITFINTL